MTLEEIDLLIDANKDYMLAYMKQVCDYAVVGGHVSFPHTHETPPIMGIKTAPDRLDRSFANRRPVSHALSDSTTNPDFHKPALEGDLFHDYCFIINTYPGGWFLIPMVTIDNAVWQKQVNYFEDRFNTDWAEVIDEGIQIKEIQ